MDMNKNSKEKTTIGGLFRYEHMGQRGLKIVYIRISINQIFSRMSS